MNSAATMCYYYIKPISMNFTTRIQFKTTNFQLPMKGPLKHLKVENPFIYVWTIIIHIAPRYQNAWIKP